MQNEMVNLLFSGVGGQGIILAGKIVAKCALEAGFDVKSNELHGMAQRGGSVINHIRFGKKVYSPMIPLGEADFLVAMEELEALRYIKYLKRNGHVIMNKKNILPAGLEENASSYPKEISNTLKKLNIKISSLDAEKIALEAGSVKIENIVLLGSLSNNLPIPLNICEETIKTSVPEKTIKMNLLAFEKGRSSN
jgi:indolepyruvate ferredoxin oxidoreductase beta subunit